MVWLSNQIKKTILTFILGKGSDLVGFLSLFALQVSNINWGFISIAENPKARMSTFLSLGLPCAGHSLQLGKKVLFQ